MIRAWHLSTLFLIILFFWPTYFGGINENLGQKLHYFIVAISSVILALFLKEKKLRKSGFSFFIPSIILVIIVFSLRVPIATYFEIGIIVKIVLFALTLNFTYIFIERSLHIGKEDRFVNGILLVFFLEAVFIIFQFFLRDNAILQIWSARTVESYFGIRAPGTFEWVYSLCYINVFILSYLGFGLNQYSFFKTKGFVALALLFAFCLFTLLSQSKSGYLAITITFFYGLVLDRALNGNFNWQIIKFAAFLLIVLSSTFIYFDVDLSYVANFVNLINSDDIDSSTAYRLHQIDVAWSMGLENWYRGVEDSGERLIIENAYFDFFYRYGVVGFFSYLTYLALVNIYTFRTLRLVSNNYTVMKENSSMYRLALAVHLTFFSSLWFSFSFAPLDGYKTSAWSLFCLALSMALNRRQMKISRSQSAMIGVQNFAAPSA